MTRTDELIQNVYGAVCKMSDIITDLSASVTALIEENKKAASDRAKLEQIAAILNLQESKTTGDSESFSEHYGCKTSTPVEINQPESESKAVKSKTLKLSKAATAAPGERKRQTIESYRKELESLTALENPTKQEKNRIAYIKWALAKKESAKNEKVELTNPPLYRVLTETKNGYFEVHSINLTLEEAEALIADLHISGKRAIKKPMAN